MAAKHEEIKSGPSSAAVLAAGIGSLVFGVVTLIAEVSAGFSSILVWIKPVGALSGKSIVGVVAWLLSWVILGAIWKGKDVRLVRTLIWSAVFLVLGLVCTFPPFFEAIKGS